MSATKTNTHLAPVLASAGTTPALSPASSVGPSPALTDIASPPLGPSGPFNLVDATKTSNIPECWGHRGASADYPENTKASFVAACKAGADGLETDIHMTADNVLVLFHDPQLGRTTTGSGKIHDQPWHGGLEHVRTKAEPVQPIPKFTEVLDLMVEAGNEHVKLNIDCKVENDPTKLFTLMKSVIETYPQWDSRLAPRLILGIWHPKFILPAAQILPFLPRYAISMSVPEVRKHFFKYVHGFSVRYEYMASSEGVQFRKECKEGGKGICVFTVNGKEEMRNCARWGVQSVISDKPDQWREIKKEIVADRARALQPTLQTLLLPYIQKKNWWFDYRRQAREETEYLEREGGKFDDVVIPEVSLKIIRPSDVLPSY